MAALAVVGAVAILVGLFFELTGRTVTKSEVWSNQLERAPLPAPGGSPMRSEPEGARPRNVILVVADGMGFAHLTAGRAAHHGIDGEAVWDAFPVAGWHRSHPVGGLLTDSATAATSLATGRATKYGYVGVDEAGQPVATLFERAAEMGYRTGIVTDSYIWDATPAAFVAHVQDRDQAATILEQLTSSKLEVLFGELEDVGEGEVPEWQETVDLLSERFKIFGPEPVTVTELLSVERGRPVAALFEEDQVTDLSSEPNLATLQQAGLHRLLQLSEPFVLLVESEELDSASHRQDLDRVVNGLEAIDAVLADLLEFAENDCETLLVFTSDHETGGLAISTERGNLALKAIWSTTDHTAEPVPLFAIGPGAELFGGQQSTWEVGQKLLSLLRAPDSTEETPSGQPAESSPLR